MAKTYETVGWEDSPSLKTPINARNLKHMDDAIKDLYDGGASSADIVISPEQPTTEDWKIWIDSDEVINSGTEVVDNLDGNQNNLSPSVRAVKEELNNYSTEEARIGTWINGKPLYRKVINFGVLPNATVKKVAHNLTNYNCIKLYGIAISGENSLPLPYVNEDNFRILLDINTDGVRINTFSTNRSAYNGYVIIEYTKTTD